MASCEVVTIVEGHGDKDAVSILVRRVAETINESMVVKTVPLRSTKGKLCKREAFSNQLAIARRYVGSGGSVLVVMDADDNCPKEINELLLGWANSDHSDLNVSVVVAKREMESWFIAGSSLWDTAKLGDPESFDDPKGWVAEHLKKGYYAESVDQPRMAAKLDIEKAKEASSFDKFVRDVARLLAAG